MSIATLDDIFATSAARRDKSKMNAREYLLLSHLHVRLDIAHAKRTLC